MVYYPQDLKYIGVHAPDASESGNGRRQKITRVKAEDWNLSIILSWVVFVHM
jgi:hypothetical protein